MTAGSYFSESDCDLAAFAELIDRRLAPASVPAADRVVQNVPIYRAVECGPDQRGEWAWVLGQGPGVLVLEGAVSDLDALDRATDIYLDIIAAETKAEAEAGAAGGKADHFAAAGSNARVWNALQKLCLSSPATFARYFAAPALAYVCEAWLGPGYQMTAQVNLVRPGGAAQEAHRDYHLGFQTAAGAAAFPAHAHVLSAALTLQGAVAHCDMPVESGPTKLLPFSQLFGPGYLAYRLPAFRDLFDRAHVQLPLAKGDAVFFNPALFHAAGANQSADIQRMANLLQVSSAFGRAMESVDRLAMCRTLYPALQTLSAAGQLSPEGARAAIAAAAEGYPFPTNLDTDPPVGGLAPQSQAEYLAHALASDYSPADVALGLSARDARRRP